MTEPNPRYWVLKGKGGIGNRLIVLAQALVRLRGEDNVELVIEWTDYYFSSRPERNAFFDVFDTPGCPIRHSRDIPNLDRLRVHPSCWHGYLEQDIDPYQLSGGGKWRMAGPDKGMPSSVDLKVPLLTADVFVSCKTPGSFLELNSPSWLQYREALRGYLTLSEALRQRVARELAGMTADGQPLAGVHVRQCAPSKRGDIGQLFQLTDALPESHSIYLATDSQNVLTWFRDRYGTRRIRALEKWYSPTLESDSSEANALHRGRPSCADSPETILKDAVTEMFLLASCDSLIFQRNSTFSQISAMYSDSKDLQGWGSPTTS